MPIRIPTVCLYKWPKGNDRSPESQQVQSLDKVFKFEFIQDVMVILSLFIPRMKKIRSKLKALEWPQYKILIFQTLKGS